MTFNCKDCAKEIINKDDLIPFFDNDLCADCEAKMFREMANTETGLDSQLHALNVNDVSSRQILARKARARYGYFCDACMAWKNEPVTELEANDHTIRYCAEHLESFNQRFAPKV